MKPLPRYGIALCQAVARNLLTPDALRRLRDVCPECDQPRPCDCGRVTYTDPSAVYRAHEARREERRR